MSITRMNCRGVFSILLGTALGVALVSRAASAESPKTFQEGTSGPASLRYGNDLPVLVVEGTPEEIGKQTAALTASAMKRLADVPQFFVAMLGHQEQYSRYLAASRVMLERFPPDHRKELEVCAAAAGLDRDKMLAMNTVVDIFGGIGCSTLVVEGPRSTTGSPLMGRNLDLFPMGVLQNYNMVVVCRPKGKLAYAGVAFPGIVGVLSGMNSQGLALVVHGVFSNGNGQRSFDLNGTPCTMLYRRVMEECSTVDQAAELLRRSRHTTALSVVLCDRRGGAVVETAPEGVSVRRSESGVCACTNHFRAGRNLSADVCPRYATLIRRSAAEKLGPGDIARTLNEVNQGVQTLQTMIFEPGPLELSLAVGSCPSSALPMKKLQLAPLYSASAPTENTLRKPQ